FIDLFLHAPSRTVSTRLAEGSGEGSAPLQIRVSQQKLSQRLQKLCRPLLHALNMYRQLQPAAVFNERDQLVEVRPGMRTNQHDSYRMKQVFALRASLRLDLIHDRLEPFRR